MSSLVGNMITYGLGTEISIILLAYAVLLFCLAVYKPKLGLYLIIPIIGLGFADSSVIKGGFIAVLTLAAMLHLLVRRTTYSLRREVLLLVLVILLFAIWVLIRGLITHESISFWVFWVVKRLLAPGLLALFTVFFIRTEKEVITFIKILCGFAAVTALWGVLQYFSNNHFFWEVRELLGVPASIAYQIAGKVRITGLSSYVVPLSYQLLSVFPLALSLIMLKPKKISYPFLAILTAGLLFFCLVFTFMKAGIAAAALGGFVMYLLFLRFRILKPGGSLFIAFALIPTLVFTLLTTNVSEKIFSLGDTSYERIPIALAAIKIFSMYPLGVGYAYSEHVSDIYLEINQFVGSKAALVQFPHNLFLNISVILGLPALILAIFFYILLFQNLWKLFRLRNRRLKIITIGLGGSFVAYLLNVMFHNNSPFFGDTFNWLIIGLAIAVIHIGYTIPITETNH